MATGSPETLRSHRSSQGQQEDQLDRYQMRKLLVRSEGDKVQALYILAITTGMHSGELLR